MWKPIETAPKDGTEIIGIYVMKYSFGERPTVYGPWTVAYKLGQWVASWDGSFVLESEGYWGAECKTPDIEPTHWMPLPPPPEAE